MDKKLNTYRVKVGRRTKNGMEVMHEFVVNSTDQQHNIQRAYEKRYTGFVVNIEAVDTVELVASGDDVEVQNTNDKASNVKYIDSTAYSAGHHRATIFSKDIPKWTEMKKKLSEAQKSLETATKDFKEYVETEFSLSGVEQFSINYDNVTFRFNHVAFDFKAKRASQTE